MSLALRELLAFEAILVVFTLAGLPLARCLPTGGPSVRPAAAVVAWGWFAVVSTLLYRFGLPPGAALLPLFAVALVGLAHVVRSVRSGARPARSWAAWPLAGAALLPFLLAPAWLGGARFALFQGNHWDHRNYVSAAVAYRLHSYADLARAEDGVGAYARPPAAEFEQFGGLNLQWRPSVSIGYAALGGLLPRSLVTSGYAFCAWLQVLWFLATASLLVGLFGVRARWAALLALAASVGFFAQYVFDINAWSEMAAVPLALVALGTLAGTLAGQAPFWRQAAHAACALVPIAYLYPEMGLVMAVPCALLPAYLARREGRFWRPVGALALATLVVVLACVPFWLGTVGFVRRQLTEGTGAFEPPGFAPYFQAYLRAGERDSAPSLGGTLQHALAWTVHTAGGLSGLYFLRPPNSIQDPGRAVLRLLMAAAFLALLAQAARCGGSSLGAGGPPGAFVFATLASGLVPLERWLSGHPWQAGKGWSMVAPFWFLVLALPLFKPAARSRSTAWPAALFALAHLAFGLVRPLAARAPGGVHYPPPYPAVQDVELKQGRSWDLDRLPALLAGCRSVAVSLEDFWQEAYVQAYLSDVGTAWTPRRPVRADDGWTPVREGDTRPRECLLAQGSTYMRAGERVIWWEPGQAVQASLADVCGELAVLPAARTPARPKGDLDGDGSPDVFLQDPVSGELFVWLMRGPTCLGQIRITPDPPRDARLAAVGDLDGDGRQDLVLERSAPTRLEIWRLSQAEGAQREGPPLAVGPPSEPAGLRLVGSADMDRDGRADLLWQERAGGRVEIWTMNGPSHVGTLVPDPAGPQDLAWKLVAAPDVDDDGQADLVFQRDGSARLAFWFLDQRLQRRTALLLPPPEPKWRLVAWLPRVDATGAVVLVGRRADGGLGLWDVSPTGVLGAERTLMVPNVALVLQRPVAGPR